MSAQPWSAKKRWIVLLLGILFVPVVGLYGFKAWQRYSIQISTDNAYVQADIAQNMLLRVGLSVEVSIDTSDRQGPLLSSLHQGDPQAPTTTSPTAHLEPDQRSLLDPAGYHGK